MPNQWENIIKGRLKELQGFDALQGQSFYPADYYEGLYGMPLSSVTATREKNGLPQVPKEGWKKWWGKRVPGGLPAVNPPKQEDIKNHEDVKAMAIRAYQNLIASAGNLMHGDKTYTHMMSDGRPWESGVVSGVGENMKNLGAWSSLANQQKKLMDADMVQAAKAAQEGFHPLYGDNRAPIRVNAGRMKTFPDADGKPSTLRGEYNPDSREIDITDRAIDADPTLWHELFHSTQTLPDWNIRSYRERPNEITAFISASMPRFIQQYGKPVLTPKDRDIWFKYFKKENAGIYKWIKNTGYSDEDIKFLGGAVVENPTQKENNLG